VQFHPSVTYEDFVVGLSPEPSEHGLHFNVKPGWLMQAVLGAQKQPFLLVIDEINRADLGRVLGEAVYLFEADEVGKQDARHVELTHAMNGSKQLKLPANLFVLATMNTADRSIARMDLAIRRRFAFVTVPPNPAPVDRCGISLAKEAFSRIQQVFVEHGTDEVLDLMPGHAYFLAANDADLRMRMRFSLLPLLGEYLQLGLMGSAHADLETVRDWLEDELAGRA
jgi:5-methylcytosine-specific restriction protein B